MVVPESAQGIRDAIDRQGLPVTRLVALGGDGLVHAIVGEAVARRVPLGIVAAGTGNDFGRAFGLPTKLAPAVGAALSEATPVDLMKAGEAYVATVATAGFSADVNDRANNLSFPPGQSKYSVATLLQLRHLRSFPVTIVADCRTTTRDVSMIAVANTAYFGGGMKVLPEASGTDGLLHLMTVDPIKRREMLRFLPTTFWGGHVRNKAVSISSVKEVALTLPEKVRLWGDGEPLSYGAVKISIEPGCLLLAGVR
ncbi:MAG: diacylglycerol kinase family protein [Acidimicrobiales bacterium]